MNFLKLFARGAAGASVLTLAVNLVLIALSYGAAAISVAFVPLAIQAVVTGAVFGVVFSLLHIKREPTLLSSFGSGVAYLALMVVLSIVLGTFAGVSLPLLVSVLVTSAVLGGGAYLGTRIGR